MYVPSSSETTILELTDPELTYLGGFNTSSGRWMRPWQVLRNTRYVQNYWRELAKPLMRRVRIRVSVQACRVIASGKPLLSADTARTTGTHRATVY